MQGTLILLTALTALSGRLPVTVTPSDSDRPEFRRPAFDRPATTRPDSRPPTPPIRQYARSAERRLLARLCEHPETFHPRVAADEPIAYRPRFGPPVQAAAPPVPARVRSVVPLAGKLDDTGKVSVSASFGFVPVPGR